MSSYELENDKSVEQMLEYFQEVGRLVNTTHTGDNIQYITQAAYYDTIGGCVSLF